MAFALMTERYAGEIAGVLSCYDRVILSGNLEPLCYAKGMTKFLYGRGIRIFDYGKQFAEPLRDAIRTNAEDIAQAHGLEIEFIRKQDSFRKEDRIQQVLAERGDHPGLVHIFSAMERCQAYRPWHDKQSGHTYVKAEQGKCLHYYFYLIDPDLGLCCLRVPTWCPFRLQFYFNGHNALAAALKGGGFSNKILRTRLPHKNSSQITRLLKRLRVHGLVKRAGKRYRYYLTDFGCQVATLSLKLREMVVIPALAHDRLP